MWVSANARIVGRCSQICSLRTFMNSELPDWTFHTNTLIGCIPISSWFKISAFWLSWFIIKAIGKFDTRSYLCWSWVPGGTLMGLIASQLSWTCTCKIPLWGWTVASYSWDNSVVIPSCIGLKLDLISGGSASIFWIPSLPLISSLDPSVMIAEWPANRGARDGRRKVLGRTWWPWLYCSTRLRNRLSTCWVL